MSTRRQLLEAELQTSFEPECQADDEWLVTSSDTDDVQSSGPENLPPSSSDDGYHGVYSDPGEFTGQKPRDASSGLLYFPKDRSATARTWVSHEEAARTAYRKCMANIHHMSCDASPGVADSFTHWVDLKAAYAEAKLARMKHRLKMMCTNLETKRCEIARDRRVSEVSQRIVTVSEKLTSTAQCDLKSPVLMRTSIWNSHYSLHPQVEWPAYLEFKNEGDNRVKGRRAYGRKLPLPRLRKLDKAHHHRLETDLKSIPIEGAGIPYSVREVAAGLVSAHMDTMPQTEWGEVDVEAQKHTASVPVCSQRLTTEQILLEEVDGFTRELLQEIDDWSNL